MTRKYSARRPEQGEGVGDEDDVRLLGDPEHRRDGVQREQQVGAADRDQHDEQRRHHPPAVDARDAAPVVVVVGDRKHPPGGRTRALFSTSGSSSRCRYSWMAVQISSSPKIRNMKENSDEQGRAERDEDGPQHQRQDDAEDEHLVLVLGRAPRTCVRMMTKTKRLSTDRLFSTR